MSDREEPSRFNSWHDWPEELVPAIRKLVRGWYWVGVFKCDECEAFCKSHPYGAAHIRGHGRGIPTGTERGVPICDDCLLRLAADAPSRGQNIRSRERR